MVCDLLEGVVEGGGRRSRRRRRRRREEGAERKRYKLINVRMVTMTDR